MQNDEFPELEIVFDFRKCEREPDIPVGGRSIPDKVVSQEYESEVWRAQRRSPRCSADSFTWKAMLITIQDACST